MQLGRENMSAELVVNLWAFYDSSNAVVYALAGRAYALDGEDREKLAVLRNLSRTDYVTATRHRVPSRFKIHDGSGAVRSGVCTLNAVADSNAQLFEEVFRGVESELPPLPDFSGAEFRAIPQKLPQDPLCVTTVLYEDEFGNIRPIINDEDRAWIDRQERAQGR